MFHHAELVEVVLPSNASHSPYAELLYEPDDDAVNCDGVVAFVITPTVSGQTVPV